MPEIPYEPSGSVDPSPDRSGGPKGDPEATPSPGPEGGTTPLPGYPSGGVTSRPGSGAPRGGATRGRGRSYGRKRTSERSLTSWEYWWGLNKDRFLWNSVRRLAATESSECSLGEGTGETGTNSSSSVPSEIGFDFTGRVLPVCEDSLSSDVCDQRIAALLSMGKLRTPNVMSRVLQGFRDDCPTVRASAVLSLGINGGPLVVPILTDLLEDTAHGRRLMGRSRVMKPARCYAAAALGISGHEQARVPLERALALPAADLEVSLSAAVAIGALGDPRSSETLAQIVQDRSRDRRLRAHGLASLGRLGDRRVLPLIQAFLEGKDGDLRRSAILAVAALAEKDDLQVVRSLQRIVYSEKDELGVRWSLIGLGEIGGEGARKTLLKTLAGSIEGRRAFAALGLGVLHFGGVPPTADLRTVRGAFLAARSEPMRGALAVALGLLRDRESISLLGEIVTGSASPELRGHAAVALGLMVADKAEPAILEILTEPGKPQLRWDAARALGRVGSGVSLDRLTRSLKVGDRGRFEVEGAALSLGYLGRLESVDPLCRLVADERLSSLEKATAIQGLGFLLDRHRGSEELPAQYRLKSHCNYGVPFPALNGFFQMF